MLQVECPETHAKFYLVAFSTKAWVMKSFISNKYDKSLQSKQENPKSLSLQLELDLGINTKPAGTTQLG
jgi:hypothetical protein